jgi:hypothetical protein
MAFFTARMLGTPCDQPRRSAAEQRDELAAGAHSITSSARASKVGEKAGQELSPERRLKSNSPLPD